MCSLLFKLPNLFFLGELRASNPHIQQPQCCALPIKLNPPVFSLGFEPKLTEPKSVVLPLHHEKIKELPRELESLFSEYKTDTSPSMLRKQIKLWYGFGSNKHLKFFRLLRRPLRHRTIEGKNEIESLLNKICSHVPKPILGITPYRTH